MLKKSFKAALPAMLLVAIFATTLVSCGSSEEKTEEATETVAPAAVDSPATVPTDSTIVDSADTRPVVPPNK